MDINSKFPLSMAFIALIGLSVGATGGLITENIGLNNQITTEAGHQAQLTDNVDTGYNIKVYHNGEFATTTHNKLMEGENAIKESIGQGAGNTYDTIAVGKGNAPGDSSGSLDQEYSNCGLSPATGSYEDTGDGQWNYTVTYDVTCDNIIVNTTAIKSTGASSSYDYFAGADLGRDINPYSGDTITIEWSNTADDS